MPASLSGVCLRSSAFRDDILAAVLDGRDLDVTFDNFPYYLRYLIHCLTHTLKLLYFTINKHASRFYRFLVWICQIYDQKIKHSWFYQGLVNILVSVQLAVRAQKVCLLLLHIYNWSTRSKLNLHLSFLLWIQEYCFPVQQVFDWLFVKYIFFFQNPCLFKGLQRGYIYFFRVRYLSGDVGKGTCSLFWG